MLRSCRTPASAVAWAAAPAAAGAAGEQPGTASRPSTASAADPIVARVRIPRFRCVTLRQDTGFGRPVSRARHGWECGPRHSRRLAGMAGTDPAHEIAALTAKLANIGGVLDPTPMQPEAAGFRGQPADLGLWADQHGTQKVTRRLSYLEAELGRLAAL